MVFDLTLYFLAFACYAGAFVLYALYAARKREVLSTIGFVLILSGAIFHLGSLAARFLEGCHYFQKSYYILWVSWFECFSLLAWFSVVIFLVTQRKDVIPILGVFLTPILLVLMALGLLSPTGTQLYPLPPNFPLSLLFVHVPLMFFCYAAFANAAALGFAYLVQERQLKSRKPSHLAFRLPPLETLDRQMRGILLWSVPLLTLGLCLGGLWATRAFGMKWHIDVKVLASFITWALFVWAVVARRLFHWRGRRTATLVLAGFFSAILTFVCVNFYSNFHQFFKSRIPHESSGRRPLA